MALHTPHAFVGGGSGGGGGGASCSGGGSAGGGGGGGSGGGGGTSLLPPGVLMSRETVTEIAYTVSAQLSITCSYTVQPQSQRLPTLSLLSCLSRAPIQCSPSLRDCRHCLCSAVHHVLLYSATPVSEIAYTVSAQLSITCSYTVQPQSQRLQTLSLLSCPSRAPIQCSPSLRDCRHCLSVLSITCFQRLQTQPQRLPTLPQLSYHVHLYSAAPVSEIADTVSAQLSITCSYTVHAQSQRLPTLPQLSCYHVLIYSADPVSEIADTASAQLLSRAPIQCRPSLRE